MNLINYKFTVNVRLLGGRSRNILTLHAACAVRQVYFGTEVMNAPASLFFLRALGVLIQILARCVVLAPLAQR